PPRRGCARATAAPSRSELQNEHVRRSSFGVRGSGSSFGVRCSSFVIRRSRVVAGRNAARRTGNANAARRTTNAARGTTNAAPRTAPPPRPALHVGKLLGVLLLLGLAEALLTPLTALLFQAALFSRPLLLAALLATGTIGFSAVGTLFAAMLVRARSRDVLLPILLYPITIPVIIAGVRGTSALLASPPDATTAAMWISILTAFDVVFVTLALWTFEPLMTE